MQYDQSFEMSRKCESCKMIRTPDKKVVKKKGKTWAIYTCRICKQQDIEAHIPIKLFDGTYFKDEVPDESEEI